MYSVKGLPYLAQVGAWPRGLRTLLGGRDLSALVQRTCALSLTSCDLLPQHKMHCYVSYVMLHAPIFTIVETVILHDMCNFSFHCKCTLVRLLLLGACIEGLSSSHRFVADLEPVVLTSQQCFCQPASVHTSCCAFCPSRGCRKCPRDKQRPI